MNALHPYDRVVQALCDHGSRVLPKRDSQGRDAVRAVCPTHSDRKPSVVVTRDGPNALLKCFGRCPTKKVLAALNLTLADLFSGPRQPMGQARIIAMYNYIDLHGVFIGQKVRMLPKTFRWRRPDPQTPGRWLRGLRDPAGLYCIADLIDSATVFLTEGERAVDLLWSHGLAATCPPLGASTWKLQWSLDLHTVGVRELIVLADHDQAGAHHAEVVAGITAALEVDEPIAVKVILLPDLAHKADVVDWFDAGHGAEDLLAVVAAAPIWTPDGTERARADRKRQLNLVRQHRCRANRRLSRSVCQTTGHETQHVSEPEAVTHRMLGLSPVTRRMSEPEAVTRHAVTLPNVLLSSLQGSDLLSAVDAEEVLPDWVTADEPPLDPSDSDFQFALHDEDAERLYVQEQNQRRRCR